MVVLKIFILQIFNIIRDVRSKNFCYDTIPEFGRDFETQSWNVDVISDHICTTK